MDRTKLDCVGPRNNRSSTAEATPIGKIRPFTKVIVEQPRYTRSIKKRQTHGHSKEQTESALGLTQCQCLNWNVTFNFTVPVTVIFTVYGKVTVTVIVTSKFTATVNVTVNVTVTGKVTVTIIVPVNCVTVALPARS